MRERTVADLVPGVSSWHDYTTCLPSLEKFFPHRDLEPLVDGEHVRPEGDPQELGVLQGEPLLALDLEVGLREELGLHGRRA